MQGDLNRPTGKKTATGNNYQSRFYILLSSAKNRVKILLLNFEAEDVKVNKLALDEMVRMRNELLFSWKYPSRKLNGISMYLFNVRSWNVHL